MRDALRLPLAVALAARAARIAFLAAPHQLLGAGFRAERFQRADELIAALQPAGVVSRALGERVRPYEVDAVVARAHDLDELFLVVEQVDHIEPAAQAADLLRRRIGLLLVERRPL